MSKLDPEYEKEIEDFPEEVKVIARKYPANTCWRSTVDDEAHYCIIDYVRAKHKETGEVKITVTLAHARGTRRAGFATFGQDPAQLVLCDCGQWKPPTAEEKAQQGAKLAKFHAEQKALRDDPLKVGDIVKLAGVDTPPLPVIRIEGDRHWVGHTQELGPFFRSDLERAT